MLAWVVQLKLRASTHYDDVIMGAMVSQITSLTIVYSTVYSRADQRKHQSSASLAFVRGIHRGPGNSPHKWPVPWKMFPFDDVIMIKSNLFKTMSFFTNLFTTDTQLLARARELWNVLGESRVSSISCNCNYHQISNIGRTLAGN